MNKFTALALLIGILIFGEGAGLIYFANKSQVFSKKTQVLETEEPKYEKSSQELGEKVNQQGQMITQTKEKYDALSTEYEGIKTDRDNLLTQIRGLLGARGKAEELSSTLEKTNTALAQLKVEKEKAEKDALALSGSFKTLKESDDQLVKEHEELKVAYERARKDTIIKSLKDEISDVKRDKNNSDRDLKKAQRDLEAANRRVDQLNAKEEKLTDQLKDYRTNYADASKKNRALEHNVLALPTKFAEIARQNKVLLRQTAEMHYNLGVFYTKNKEYDRAVAEFEKVVEIKPDDAYAHFNLGYIYAEYLVNHERAVDHFRHYLRFSKSDDPDIDWVKKYLLTWETYEGKRQIL